MDRSYWHQLCDKPQCLWDWRTSSYNFHIGFLKAKRKGQDLGLPTHFSHNAWCVTRSPCPIRNLTNICFGVLSWQSKIKQLSSMGREMKVSGALFSLRAASFTEHYNPPSPAAELPFSLTVIPSSYGTPLWYQFKHSHFRSQCTL